MTDQHLVQLQWLRLVVWLAQGTTLLLARNLFPQQQFSILLVLLAAECLVILGTHIWRNSATHHADTLLQERIFFGQLLIDCLLLTGVLYVAGGATNPFVSYYLVPIALGAATLSRLLTAALMLFCLLAYSVLLFYHMPLEVLSPHHQHGGNDQLSMHVIGMWLNFGLSALLITQFVVTMAATVRQQRERINQLREQQLMDENIMAVASLAAGTAHELGTPLSSLAVMLGDWRNTDVQEPGLQDDLQLMQEQVKRCQTSLQQLAATAREHQAGSAVEMPVMDFIDRLVTHWSVLRPEYASAIQIVTGPDSRCQYPLTVDQALINLFDNAADACIQSLVICLQWDEQTLQVTIEDDGPGLQHDIFEQRARVKPSDKGMGLGLLLSHATLERVGGRLVVASGRDGGTAMKVTLPLLPRREQSGGTQ
jgi:two-component system sensor histidine kinase RegB